MGEIVTVSCHDPNSDISLYWLMAELTKDELGPEEIPNPQRTIDYTTQTQRRKEKTSQQRKIKMYLF